MRDVDRRRAACIQKAQLAYCIRHAPSHSLVIADERAARPSGSIYHCTPVRQALRSSGG